MTPILLSLFPLVMIWAAVSDLLTMKIPNRLPIGLLVGFVLLAIAAGLSPGATLPHLVAFLLVLAAGFALFALGWVGGGDAKLAAATALWVGLDSLWPYFFVTAMAGGVLTLVILVLRRLPLPTSAESWPWLARLRHPASGIPYGIALAVGALVAFPQTQLVVSLLKA